VQGATGTGSEVYLYNGNLTYAYESWSNASYQLHKEGEFADESHNLPCVVYHLEAHDSYVYEADGGQSWSGSGSRTTGSASTGNATTSYGGLASGGLASSTYSESGTYSYSGALAYHSEESGNANSWLDEEGSYAGSSYALDIVVFDKTGTVSYSYSENGSQESAGGGEATTFSGNGGAGTFSMAGKR
jgi:hypothetical protein